MSRAAEEGNMSEKYWDPNQTGGGNPDQKAAENHFGYDPDLVRAMNALAYLWILFFLPLVVTPKHPSSRFHANQGLVNLLFYVVLNVAAGIAVVMLAFIPVAGVLFGILLEVFVQVVGIVFTILGILHAVNDQQKELPVIGKIRLLK